MRDLGSCVFLAKSLRALFFQKTKTLITNLIPRTTRGQALVRRSHL